MDIVMLLILYDGRKCMFYVIADDSAFSIMAHDFVGFSLFTNKEHKIHIYIYTYIYITIEFVQEIDGSHHSESLKILKAKLSTRTVNVKLVSNLECRGRKEKQFIVRFSSLYFVDDFSAIISPQTRCHSLLFELVFMLGRPFNRINIYIQKFSELYFSLLFSFMFDNPIK